MNARAAVLVALGLAAMVGDLTGLGPLYGLGVAWGASPAPRVFATRDGLEGFSATYEVVGPQGRVQLDPATNGRLRGPYNRRNVYGAALAGGPFLTEHEQLGDLHAAVAQYAFCGEHTVLDELGVEVGRPVALVVSPRAGTQTDLPLILAPQCR